jgi:D-alanyl-D-alanine carboxypeptidase
VPNDFSSLFIIVTNSTLDIFKGLGLAEMKFNLQKALIVPLALIVLGSFFSPLKSNSASSSTGEETETARTGVAQAAVQPELALAAVDNYLNRLLAAGCPPSDQAILIQTLDGKVLVDHNSDTPLNPASVMKLTTTYLALKHFGPEYQFKTTAYTTGRIDESKRTLYGDLIIESEGDPSFTLSNAAALGATIRSKGIQRVEGTLRVEGPFRFQGQSSLQYAYTKMKSVLGLGFPKQMELSSSIADPTASERQVLGIHESKPLKELLLYMNAHSNNFYADQLGDALGGPDAVRAVLLKEFELRPTSLYISHTSGLSYNRITPRASIAIFRKLIELLKGHQMHVENIMPVAGVDSGTLTARLRQPGFQGSVVAKTGTLTTTDNGVSTLQGVIYSERYGPLLFAIFNTGGHVNYFRQNQDRFLMEAITEMGTSLVTVRTENILAPQMHASYTPSFSRLHVKRVSSKNHRGRTSVRYRRR